MPETTKPRNLIIGTAGHIDHGKTVLVKALTGRDTDRLAEEKERGISIDLGFAPMTFSDGSVVGIVDVPGHESFVRNMMAGATGVDLALLVVAADDGVMPQTREHLAILDLLGVTRGVVAVTKIDAVEAEMVELVVDEVRELLEGTPLEGSPIVGVSGLTGEGVDELRAALEEQARAVVLKDEQLPPRLPIDRVFTLKGIGTVVTGTLWSGSIAPGERLEVLPRVEEVRVRTLQVHDLERDRVLAGERVAVNLAGVPREKVERGDVLAAPGYLRPAYMLDARVRILRDWTRRLKRGARIRFHHGTREVLGRIYPLDGGDIAPGESKPVQLRLEQQVVVAPGDRFVVRSYSPVTTIGGGVVVDVRPGKHRLQDAEALRLFEELASGDTAKRAGAVLERAAGPATVESVALSAGLSREDAAGGLAGLAGSGEAVALGEKGSVFFLSRAEESRAREAVLGALSSFHAAKPLADGMAKETLKKQALPRWDARAADAFMDLLVSEGAVESEGKLARLPGTGAAVTGEQRKTIDEVVGRIAASPASPPTVSELAGELGLSRQAVAELLSIAVGDGRLVRVSPELFFSPAAIDDIRTKLTSSVGPDGITVSDFRVVAGTSRKFALPLLEYFDRERVTVRVGDVRKLR